MFVTTGILLKLYIIKFLAILALFLGVYDLKLLKYSFKWSFKKIEDVSCMQLLDMNIR